MIYPGAAIEVVEKWADDYSRLLIRTVKWNPTGGHKEGDPKVAMICGEFLPITPVVKAGDIIDTPDLPWRLRAIEDYLPQYDGVLVMRFGGLLPILRVMSYRIRMGLIHIKERLIMTAWVWGLARRPRPGYPLTWRDIHMVRRLIGDA